MTIIDHLKSFNRKERFHLVGQLLGNKEFELDGKVLEMILGIFNLKKPDNHFSAMDYHLDWIYASLKLASYGSPPKKFEMKEGCIKGTQEDVDFLIAFEDEEKVTHLIMIEAKGDASFTTNQLKSKAERLKTIFVDETWAKVVPYFALCSPVRTKLNPEDDYPKFMKNNENKFYWFPLEMQADKLKKVVRFNENGDESPPEEGKYKYWKVKDPIKRKGN